MKSTVAKIRDELRSGKSSSLERRRKIALLAAIGAVDFSIISLFQLGVIRKLPDIPTKLFDSNKVNASEKAYGMHLPDGTSGVTMYGVTMMLSAIGGSSRTGRTPWATIALGTIVVGATVGALDYLYDMTFKQKKACAYCLLGAAVNFAMVPLVWKEFEDSIIPMLKKKKFTAALAKSAFQIPRKTTMTTEPQFL